MQQWEGATKSKQICWLALPDTEHLYRVLGVVLMIKAFLCRARAAAEAVGGPQDEHGVPAGSYVVVHVSRVPSAAAAALVARIAAYLQVLLFLVCKEVFPNTHVSVVWWQLLWCVGRMARHLAATSFP